MEEGPCVGALAYWGPSSQPAPTTHTGKDTRLQMTAAPAVETTLALESPQLKR